METVDFTNQLVSVAQAGAHKKQEQIKNIREYFAALTLIRSVDKIVRGFNLSAKLLFREYRKNVKHGIFTNDEILTTYKTFLMCADFYVIEHNIIDAELAEFTLYWIFHPITITLGFNRRGLIVQNKIEDIENKDNEHDTKGDK